MARHPETAAAGLRPKEALSRAPELELCKEAKLCELLGYPATERFEASGVVAVDGVCYVIFDNTSLIASIGVDIRAGDERNHLIHQQLDRNEGYEDIAYDRSSGRFLVLIEGLPHRGRILSKVREYDPSFGDVSSGWLDFPLVRANKGLEGLTCVHRGDQMYLLALCEGNLCEAGAAGRQPGGGRIQVFARADRGWDYVDTIALPASLPFEDYSSLALAGERLCVVSQESSALWLGTLADSEWRVVEDLAIYRFPTNEDGKVVYGNVEGVSWLSGSQLVTVSDKTKPEQKKRCEAKDQSIHVFTIPPA